MNKKLIAVAVAGMFVAPAAALAQSSVTISGKVMASFGQFKMSGRGPAAVGNSSEHLVRDESSRVVFSMREDLGGGMAAIGKFDIRYSSSESNAGQASGETFVGASNYAWALNDTQFRQSIFNNLLWLLVVPAASTLMGTASTHAEATSVAAYQWRAGQ